MKVICREEPEGGRDELETVAALVAAAINQDHLSGRLLDKFVSVLASLPDCLAPTTGFLALGIRNGLRLLDALPPLRRRRVSAPKAQTPAAPARVQKIRIED